MNTEMYKFSHTDNTEPGRAPEATSLENWISLFPAGLRIRRGGRHGTCIPINAIEPTLSELNYENH